MSHIKLWSESTNEERLSEDNVLMLCPSHDKLFDAGLISFDESGKVIVSSSLTDDVKRLMNVDEETVIFYGVAHREYVLMASLIFIR